MHRVIGLLKINLDAGKLIPEIIQIYPSQMALLIVGEYRNHNTRIHIPQVHDGFHPYIIINDKNAAFAFA